MMRAPAPCAISAVPSVDPSSTTNISKSLYVWDKTDEIVVTIDLDLLYSGIRTEIMKLISEYLVK